MLPRAISEIVGSTHTLEIKTYTYFEHGSYESFTCSAICADQAGDDEDAGSSTVEEIAASETNPIEPSKENLIERLINDTSIRKF